MQILGRSDTEATVLTRRHFVIFMRRFFVDKIIRQAVYHCILIMHFYNIMSKQQFPRNARRQTRGGGGACVVNLGAARRIMIPTHMNCVGGWG